MKKILWISPYALFDQVGHAGGKTQNFYLKRIKKSKMFDVYLIACFQSEEKGKLDLEDYKIAHSLIEISSKKEKQLVKKLINIESTINPFHKYAGLLQNYTAYLLKRGIKKYEKAGGTPDIIILAWTESALLMPYIKKLFPDSKIVIGEEDVAFVGYERKWHYAKRKMDRWMAKCRYKRLHNIELNALKSADMIINTSYKDQAILMKESIDKRHTFVWTPYFEDYNDVVYNQKNKDILFFGAMSRLENYLSAIWFIKNVFMKLDDRQMRFVIIGGHPPKELLEYGSERIKVLGFVEDVRPYFSSSLCLVAPLVLGAGIKVKVLEALSAGIPVLTNGIGVEGIPVRDNRDYFYCQKPEDYVKKINLLVEHPEMGMQISINGKKFIKENYNLDDSANQFTKRLAEL